MIRTILCCATLAATNALRGPPVLTMPVRFERKPAKIATLTAFVGKLTEPTDPADKTYAKFINGLMQDGGGPFTKNSRARLEGYLIDEKDTGGSSLVPSWVEKPNSSYHEGPWTGILWKHLTPQTTVLEKDGIYFACLGKKVRLGDDQREGLKFSIPPDATELQKKALLQDAHFASLDVLCRKHQYADDPDAKAYLANAKPLPEPTCGQGGQRLDIYAGDRGVFNKKVAGETVWFTMVGGYMEHVDKGAARRHYDNSPHAMDLVATAANEGHFLGGGDAKSIPENPAAKGHKAISELGLDYFFVEAPPAAEAKDAAPGASDRAARAERKEGGDLAAPRPFDPYTSPVNVVDRIPMERGQFRETIVGGAGPDGRPTFAFAFSAAPGAPEARGLAETFTIAPAASTVVAGASQTLAESLSATARPPPAAFGQVLGDANALFARHADDLGAEVEASWPAAAAQFVGAFDNGKVTALLSTELEASRVKARTGDKTPGGDWIVDEDVMREELTRRLRAHLSFMRALMRSLYSQDLDDAACDALAALHGFDWMLPVAPSVKSLYVALDPILAFLRLHAHENVNKSYLLRRVVRYAYVEQTTLAQRAFAAEEVHALTVDVDLDFDDDVVDFGGAGAAGVASDDDSVDGLSIGGCDALLAEMEAKLKRVHKRRKALTAAAA